MEDNGIYLALVLFFGVAGLIFLSGVLALGWASRNGQLRHLDQGAKVIFDDEEPLGAVTDRFPSRPPKKAQS